MVCVVIDTFRRFTPPMLFWSVVTLTHWQTLWTIIFWNCALKEFMSCVLFTWMMCARYLILHVSFLLQKTSVGKRGLRGPLLIRVVLYYANIFLFSQLWFFLKTEKENSTTSQVINWSFQSFFQAGMLNTARFQLLSLIGFGAFLCHFTKWRVL